jgi:hypothetical protein
MEGAYLGAIWHHPNSRTSKGTGVHCILSWNVIYHEKYPQNSVLKKIDIATGAEKVFEKYGVTVRRHIGIIFYIHYY